MLLPIGTFNLFYWSKLFDNNVKPNLYKKNKDCAFSA